jgi:hypothetical protein
VKSAAPLGVLKAMVGLQEQQLRLLAPRQRQPPQVENPPGSRWRGGGLERDLLDLEEEGHIRPSQLKS